VSGRGLKCAVALNKDVPLAVGGESRNEVEVMIGNRSWLAENAVDNKAELEALMAQHEALGRTALAVAIDKRPAGVCHALPAPTRHRFVSVLTQVTSLLLQVLALADVLKPESKEVVRYLSEQMKIEVWMCTGDNRRTASVVAAQVGLKPEHVMVSERLG
jgi:cation transport ATPase